MSSSSGPLLVGVGIIIVLVGLLVWFGGLTWFGRLPGDIRIERETARVYFPFASMLVVSLLLSLFMYLWRRFF